VMSLLAGLEQLAHGQQKQGLRATRKAMGFLHAMGSDSGHRAGSLPGTDKGPELKSDEASADADEHIWQHPCLSAGGAPGDKDRLRVLEYVQSSRKEDCCRVHHMDQVSTPPGPVVPAELPAGAINRSGDKNSITSERPCHCICPAILLCLIRLVQGPVCMTWAGRQSSHCPAHRTEETVQYVKFTQALRLPVGG